jgi:hypothetical protein
VFASVSTNCRKKAEVQRDFALDGVLPPSAGINRQSKEKPKTANNQPPKDHHMKSIRHLNRSIQLSSLALAAAAFLSVPLAGQAQDREN